MGAQLGDLDRLCCRGREARARAGRDRPARAGAGRGRRWSRCQWRHVELGRTAGSASRRILSGRPIAGQHRPDPPDAWLGTRHLRFTRYSAKPAPVPLWSGPRTPTAAMSSALPGRRFWPGSGQHSGRRSRAEELAAEATRVAKAAGAHHRVIVGEDLLAENYPMSMRSAGPARAHRASSTSSGATRRRQR